MSFTQRREIFIKVQEAEEPKEEAPAPTQLAFDFVCLGRHIFVVGDDDQLRCARCGTSL